MSCLICGSIAFDTIMTFDGRFVDHILPAQLNILNVSFTVPTMRREFGGCASNIAYSYKLLGGDPVVMGVMGDDAQSYLAHFAAMNISTQHVRILPNTFTAQAIITTDLDHNQITSFHPGAITQGHLNKVSDVLQPIDLAIIAPESTRAMLEHAEQCASAGIPFIFDPGHMLGTFSREELLHTIDLASYVAVNQYEAAWLAEKTQCTLGELAARVNALIMTRGDQGATMIVGNQTYEIPSIVPSALVDPTGCGDAFRAGLLFGITQQMDWPTIARLANLLGSITVECRGPQSHLFTLDEIRERFTKIFGYRF